MIIEADVSKKIDVIELGVQGENEAEGVGFDITDWVDEYGSGTAYIYHQRKTDAAPYLKTIPITSSDGVYTATWTFDDADNAVQGEGAGQLYYVVGDVIKKTPIFITVTSSSLGEASGDTPDPYEDLLEEARTIMQQTVDARTAAVAAAVSVTASAQQIATNATNITQLSSRMDSFTHLEEGSTTGDAELIDARVGYDGTTYQSAGSAIRGQVGDLKEDLDYKVYFDAEGYLCFKEGGIE